MAKYRHTAPGVERVNVPCYGGGGCITFTAAEWEDLNEGAVVNGYRMVPDGVGIKLWDDSEIGKRNKFFYGRRFADG